MRREPLLTRAFLLCSGAHLLHSLAFSLFYHFPGYLQDLGADKLEIGLIFSLTALVAIAARPWLGRAMDLQGRRAVILVGGLLHLGVCSLYLTVTAIGPWVYAVRVLHGLAEAMLFSAFFTHAADLAPPSRRTEGIALFGLSGILPMALGGLLGDAILASAGYREVFAAAVVLAAGGLLGSLPLRDVRSRWSDGSPTRGFTSVLFQTDLLPVWFVGTVFSTALAAAFTFMKTFVVETGVGSLGLFLTTYSLAAVALRLALAWLPDRVGPKRVLGPALLALAVGLALLARADDASEIGLAGALCGLGHGFTFPILGGLVVARARDSERGTAMAIFTALFDAGLLIGGPGFGALADAFGYAAMFATAGALVAVGALAFFVWDGAPARDAGPGARRLG